MTDIEISEDPTIYHYGEPMDLIFDAHKVKKTGAYLDSQVLSYAFHHALGNTPGDPIAAIAPASVPFEAASNGDYFATIPASAEILANLHPGGIYFVRLYGGANTSLVNNRFIKIAVRYRGKK